MVTAMKDVIAKYRENYIAEMRKVVGHAPLRTIGCGVIIENDKGEILLQKRRDNGLCLFPSGYNLTYRRGSSIAKAFKAHSKQGVVSNPSAALLQSIRKK